MRVKDLRDLALEAGYAAPTLYDASKKLDVTEYIVDSRKWWRLPDPSLGPFVAYVSAPRGDT